MPNFFSRLNPSNASESFTGLRSSLLAFGLPSWFFNKYFLVFASFVAIVLFFDSFNAIERIQLSRELKSAKAEKEYYQEEIQVIQAKLDELMVNKETLEKFAREEYYMKRQNEDVFVIVEEE